MFPVAVGPFIKPATAAADYQIARSLRFNRVDSPSLTRTFSSAGHRQRLTISMWIKRHGNFGASQFIFAADTDGVNNDNIALSTEDTIWIENAGFYVIRTERRFRDPTAWFHLCIPYNTTTGTANSDLVKIFIDGVEATVQSSLDGRGTYLTAGTNLSHFMNNVSHAIGSLIGGTNHADFSIAEMHVIDGYTLSPTDFAETDPTTGAWVPKAYTGSYGTNGFYLDFSDNSNTTSGTLGADRSGNGNDWTPNNFSVSAGVGNDSLVDTPTNYGTDTGAGGEVRGNYATFDPLLWGATRCSLANGNLQYTGTGAAANFELARANQAMRVKTYWETLVPATATYYYPGIIDMALAAARNGNAAIGYWPTSYPKTFGYEANSGKVYYNSTTALATYSTAASGAIIMFAYDPATGYVWLGKDGTWFNSGDPAAGTGYVATLDTTLTYTPAITDATSQSGYVNFGQRQFAHTAPSGFKALCTQNLPTPTIVRPDDYFAVNTRTGNGSTTSVSGLRFQPDLVWIKERNGTADWAVYDSTRGVQKQLETNTTTDETTESTGLTAFNTDGFSLSSLAQVNTSADTYVDYIWKEGVTPGLDVVTYTGTGSATTVAHNLGVVPKFIIVKSRTTAGADTNWAVYHAGNTSAPETDYLLLNSTNATADLNTYWNDTAPTTSVFSIGTHADVNTSSDTYVGYVFAEVEGFSKFGSYTGNGAADGPFVWCGFRPRFVLIKKDGASGTGWHIFDSKRNTYNLATTFSLTESGAAEATTGDVDFLANGFKLRSTDTGTNAATTHVFAAFAEHPFKYSRAF